MRGLVVSRISDRCFPVAQNEIPEHIAQGTAYFVARRGTARVSARRRSVYAGGDCQAFPGRARGVPEATVHGSVLSRSEAVCYAGCAGGSAVADRERGHQFSGAAGFAVAGVAHPGTVSRADPGVQGFWRAFHGAADGLFRARRIAAAHGAGGDLGRHGQRCGARVSGCAGNSRGDSLSFEAHQRSAGKTIHDARRKHHGARSGGHV